MSKFYQPTTDSPRKQETKWINSTVHTHDLFCDCGNAIQHFYYLIQQQQKCLTTTTDDDSTKENIHVDIDGLTEKDLEELFDKDGEPEETG